MSLVSARQLVAHGWYRAHVLFQMWRATMTNAESCRNYRLRKLGILPPVERIEDDLYGHVTITDYGCWEWNRSRYPKGYGKLRWKGRHEVASRASLELKLRRPLRPGMMACHTCDNPPCINPDHLYEGTKEQNEADKRTPAQERFLAAVKATRFAA